MSGLTKGEILRVVNTYIGVEGGYLADFSYRTHQEFYPIYCELDIDPEVYVGTTRERFIQVLENSHPHIQSRILSGLLLKYPPGSNELRTTEKTAWIKELIERTSSSGEIQLTSLAITTEVVERAMSDAESLIRTGGTTSGVDRIHTALHGYLIAVCEEQGIEVGDDPSLTQLFRLIREGHPAFATRSPHEESVSRIVRSFSGAVDAINQLRNQGSLSHPNKELLDQSEATLYINATRTILAYIDSKILNWRREVTQAPQSVSAYPEDVIPF